MTLKELRKQKGLSQVVCAGYLGMPLRTYQNYENDVAKASGMKHAYMMERLAQYGLIDETHGILTTDRIAEICKPIFADFGVSYCYLFGSYAKGRASETSDIDLLISVPVSGLRFFELVEILREKLRKPVDILTDHQLKDNLPLINEILKDGIRIYG